MNILNHIGWLFMGIMAPRIGKKWWHGYAFAAVAFAAHALSTVKPF